MTTEAPWQKEQIATMRAEAHRRGMTAYGLLFEAAEAGRYVIYVLTDASDQLDFREVESHTQPVLILIHDDLAPAQHPNRWRCLRRLVRWAAGVGIFAGINGPAQFKAIIDGLERYRRIVLVLTDVHSQLDWIESAKRVPMMTLTTPGWVR